LGGRRPREALIAGTLEPRDDAKRIRASLISPLRPRDPAEAHRVSTQLELLFDLVSVIAISAVTSGLRGAVIHGHGVEALPAFAFLFAGIWWAWMNFTWFASAFDNNEPSYWLLVMVIMSGELVFAGGVGHIFSTLDASWGIVGWSIMRVGMAALWLRAAGNPEFRRTCLRYAGGVLMAQAGWIAFFFVLAWRGPAVFFPAAGACFVLEFTVPLFAERARSTPFHRHHIIERYGLLTIISLGEVMLAVSLGFGALFGRSPRPGALVTTVSGLVILFALFFLYFCEREHLPSRKPGIGLVWSYGHIFIFGAIAALGAAIGATVALAGNAAAGATSSLSLWLGVPLAIFLAALWIARDRHFALGSRGPALPATAAVAIGAALLGAPAWVFAVTAVVGVWWRVPFFAPNRP
jgi:low temperature requirement protein LtrA